MRLDAMTTDLLREAMRIYVRAAYAHKPVPLNVKSRIEFFAEHPGEHLSDMLSHEMIERVPSEEDEDVVDSYAIRLGNEKYPHMKLALRRHGPDDYRLMVEAHDRHFEVETTNPGAPRAQELQAYNRQLKAEIEGRWREADLPVVDEA
jgi:hypothetical protein